MKMTEEQIRKQIEKLNTKIKFQLEEFESLAVKMLKQKDNPDMIIFHNYSLQIHLVESELNILITAKKVYESMIG